MPRSISSYGILCSMDPLPCSAASKKHRLEHRHRRRRLKHVHVRTLPMIDDVDGFAPTAVLIGEGSRADRIWTRQEFVQICELMRNDNPTNEFLHMYCDPNGTPRFVKAKSADVKKRITWSWDTVTGRA